jgi:hypothetical protein
VHKLWLYMLFSIALAVESAPKASFFVLLGFFAASLIGLWQFLIPWFRYGELVRAHAFVHPVVFGEQLAIALLGSRLFFLETSSDDEGDNYSRFNWSIFSYRFFSTGPKRH